MRQPKSHETSHLISPSTTQRSHASYTHRVVDDELDELLRHLPALAIEGPKAVGKTATAERRVVSTFYLDDPVPL
ncbi:MAG TPA: hypothetical protein VNU46_06175 [Gemmatimonadaceae bacterium]|nr:hypothetical protein [Gemmatimonadaceae bacterium]